jgi:hypothetical protein
MCADVFIAPKSKRAISIDDFAQRTQHVACLLRAIFQKELPLAVRLKSEILGSIADLVPLMRSVLRFDRRLSRLKLEVLRLNAELSGVHRRLELPFSVHLTPDPIDLSILSREI